MNTGSIFDYAGESPMAEAANNEHSWKDNTRPSDHEVGYLWQGPWQPIADGFGEHCRRAARALYEAGAVVSLRALQRIIVDDAEAQTKNEKLLAPLLDASVGRYAAQIFMMVPTERLMEFLLLPKKFKDGSFSLEPAERDLVDAHRVVYTVWERDKISLGASQMMSRMGQCWVACTENARMLVRCGIRAERVRVVRCPHFPNDPHLTLQNRVRKPGPPRFYHIGKWEPRKAQDKILEAFLLAFRPGQAQLFMRSGALPYRVSGYPLSSTEALSGLLEREDVRKNGWTLGNVSSSVRLATKRLTEEQLLIMHKEGDVYVTLSRGEGFDMPAMDAKLSGNSMIYTPSGGPQDFAGPSDIMVHATGRVPAHEMYEWPDTTYLDFDVEQASKAMAVMADRVRKGYTTHAPEPQLERFTAAYVGKQMVQNLADLATAALPASEAHARWLSEQRP